ncbi:MAG: FAD binding domain-containing protein [Acidobacteriia bacterium]|nr:FAD binding domain-containing protein [Terriglobia bacterium]
MGISGVKEFCRPQSARDVVELLARHGDRAVLLAGGTFLHGLFARGLGSGVEFLVDLQKAGLSYVRAENGGIALGAMTTFRELAETDQVKKMPEFGALRDALQYPPAQIRNLATVGGCVASAYSLFDLPVALMALDGSVKSLGPRGPREIGLEKFFVDYFEHSLEKGEILTDVLLPKPAARSASAFLKLETNSNDLALLNAGVRLTLDQSGLCRDARVVMGGGVGKVPVRAVSCEAVLNGQRPSRALFESAAQKVSSDIHPVSDHRASGQYRRAVAKVYLRRTLLRAAERLGLTIA